MNTLTPAKSKFTLRLIFLPKSAIIAEGGISNEAYIYGDGHDLRGLLGDGHVLMDYACAALARHRDRHVALGDRVHGGAHERNMEADFFCKLCVQADLLRYHIALAGDQQDIIECKTLLCEFFRRILIDHITTSLRAAHIFSIIAHTAMACQERI